MNPNGFRRMALAQGYLPEPAAQPDLADRAPEYPGEMPRHEPDARDDRDAAEPA